MLKVGLATSHKDWDGRPDFRAEEKREWAGNDGRLGPRIP